MRKYVNFAKQLGLTNATEQSALLDIVGHLYDKFDNLNLGMSYEEFLIENYLKDIINTFKVDFSFFFRNLNLK